MVDVTAALRETRTPNEVGALRAEARERLDSPQRYERTQAEAVLATLNWLAGVGTAPVTGGDVEPTEDAISRERVRAEDAEQDALRRGVSGVAPGTVGVVLGWYRCSPYVEAPY